MKHLCPDGCLFDTSNPTECAASGAGGVPTTFGSGWVSGMQVQFDIVCTIPMSGEDGASTTFSKLEISCSCLDQNKLEDIFFTDPARESNDRASSFAWLSFKTGYSIGSRGFVDTRRPRYERHNCRDRHQVIPTFKPLDFQAALSRWLFIVLTWLLAAGVYMYIRCAATSIRILRLL